ncbi:hypothetical protein OKW43_007911 [Paraburkholderia sp. WC7.3g]|uniref:site-specific integrase n=1 Tax=Paraburkholderia sp. WC7.3g TaxID=2991070 RepID=UPI003D1C1134
MAVRNALLPSGQRIVELMNDAGEPVAAVNTYLRHLAARNCSPNTLVAYAHDLQHLWRFLAQQHLDWREVKVWHTVEFLGLSEIAQDSAVTPSAVDSGGAGHRRPADGPTGRDDRQQDPRRGLVIL